MFKRKSFVALKNNFNERTKIFLWKKKSKKKLENYYFPSLAHEKLKFSGVKRKKNILDLLDLQKNKKNLQITISHLWIRFISHSCLFVFICPQILAFTTTYNTKLRIMFAVGVSPWILLHINLAIIKINSKENWRKYKNSVKMIVAAETLPFELMLAVGFMCSYQGRVVDLY